MAVIKIFSRRVVTSFGNDPQVHMSKVLIALLVFSLTPIISLSQIHPLRYDDDFSYLDNDSVSKTTIERLKYIPIARQTRLSLGGELREQLQWYDHINFGDVPHTHPKSSTWQLWHRLMMHTNIEVNRRSRIFIQMGSTYRFLNPNPLTPEIDQNELSLHQAFIEFSVGKHWLARIGRQEMSYGSHRLITFREGPNTRLTFDAGIVRYSNERRRMDVLAVSPVIARKGVFDDESFKDFTFGIYGTEHLHRGLTLDYYFLHFYSTRRRYNSLNGVENRNILGFRLAYKQKKVNAETELTYQYGRFDQLLVSALGISADFGYDIVPGGYATIGLAGNYISGDKDKSDHRLNTFNLLYSKPQYGLAAPIGATNIITLNPYIKLRPVKKVSVYLGANFMWRQSNKDGVYSPAAIEVRPTDLPYWSPSRRLGTLFVMETAYMASSNFSFGLDASEFLAGSYVKQTGAGKNITYLSLKASFRF